MESILFSLPLTQHQFGLYLFDIRDGARRQMHATDFSIFVDKRAFPSPEVFVPLEQELESFFSFLDAIYGDDRSENPLYIIRDSLGSYSF